MTQARGQIFVATPETANLLAAAGFVAITDATFAGLVTTGQGLESFDSPSPGRLRYTGDSTYTFNPRASVSALLVAGAPVNAALRIARNGVTIEPSQPLTLSVDLGVQTAYVEALVALGQNDYVEAWIEVSADAQVRIEDFSLTVTSDEATSSTPAGSTLTTAEELAQVRLAIDKIMKGGQQWTVDGETFRRADLPALYERLGVLERRVVTEARGGIRMRSGVPIQ